MAFLVLHLRVSAGIFSVPFFFSSQCIFFSRRRLVFFCVVVLDFCVPLGVFLFFLVHGAGGCVFLLRRHFGVHYLVRVVAHVVFFSSHWSSCVLLHVLSLLVHRFLHIASHIVCVAMFSSLFHILVPPYHFPLIPWAVVACRMYSSNFLVLLFLLLFCFVLSCFWLFLGRRCFP